MEVQRCNLAACLQVVRRLEAATHTEVAKLGTNNLLRTLNAFKQAIFLCDVASRGWPVLHANAAMLEHLGTVLADPSMDGEGAGVEDNSVSLCSMEQLLVTGELLSATILAGLSEALRPLIGGLRGLA